MLVSQPLVTAGWVWLSLVVVGVLVLQPLVTAGWVWLPLVVVGVLVLQPLVTAGSAGCRWWLFVCLFGSRW
ncbi:hypothetical protein [Actinoplanes sp. DH11]|uniref:hypothetical protein n=1 Tax=Actinoplanes sp. DH11 TaxID=2857011 RepID=UPI001E542F0B|nr:hypothetical protein [Actinoplanes sp. DH11]